MRRTLLLGLAGLLLLAWGDRTVRAGPPKGPPSASGVFKEVYRNFRKSQNYEVSVKIEGGISGTKDHKIRERTVTERYAGEVYGPLMHHASPRAIRTAKSGAIYTSIGWQNILADQKGVRMDRLFSFPQKLFDRAAKYSRNARWLRDEEHEGGGETEAVLGGGDDDEAEAEDDDTPRGRTVVEKGESEPVEIPRFLRIETPPKEALEHFIEVQNSGCMSAG